LFFVFALAIGVAVLLFNPALIKSPLENYLSNLTGRPLILDGALEIEIGSQIEITAANISLSSPQWSSHQHLVSVGYLNLALETASLFKGPVVLDRIRIDDLQLNLETTADGVNNWGARQAKPAKKTTGSSPTMVVFNHIQLNDANLRYFNGKADFEHLLNLASLNQMQLEDETLQITLDGSYNDKPLAFTGNLGKYANLLDASNIAYNGSGHFGRLKLESSGLIDNLLQPKRPQFDLMIEGPDIDEVTAALGLDDLGNGPFSLQARGHEADDRFEISIYGDIDDLSLNASGKLPDLSNLDELDLTLALSGRNLGAITRPFGLKNWPDKPFILKSKIHRVGGTLNIPGLTLNIGGTELVLDALLSNFPHLDASRIKLSIDGDDIVQFRQLMGIPGVATGPFKVSGKLDVSPDSMELLEIDIQSSLGHASLSGSLGAAPTYSGSKLHLHIDGNSAHAVMAAFNVDALPEQPFSLDTRIVVVDHGLQIERGVLLTIEDERLELGGLLSLNPGGVGTDLNIKLYGKHLKRILRRLVANTEVPDQAYGLSGRVGILENGVQLDNVKAEFAGIELEVDGLIAKGDQPLSLGLEFELMGSDLSALREFRIIGDKLDMFVPGQPYKATGRFSGASDGWHFESVSGSIGQTRLDISGLISNQPELAGSNFLFSINGPDVHSLLAFQDESELPPGAFDTSGEIALSDNALSIKDLKFENENVHGSVQLEVGWPLGRDVDASFNIDIRGDDIRHLLPEMASFKPDLAAFKINAVGKKQGDLLSIKQADAIVGDFRVTLRGRLDEESEGGNAAISFSAESSRLSSLGKLNGVRLPDSSLEFKAAFTGNTKQFVLQKIAGSLGESDISGTLDVSLRGEKPNITATLHSDYIDIRPFIAPDESDIDDAKPADSDRMIPSTPLPLQAMNAADFQLNIKIAELRYKGDSLKNINLGAVMQSGHLKVEGLTLEGPRGKVRTSLSIMPTTADKAAITLDMQAESLLLNITGQADEQLDKAPRIDMSLHASGGGSNLQEVAGSTNGYLLLGSRGGELKGVNLSVLDTFILDEIFSLILPKSDAEDDLNLTCAATILNITDGLVSTDPAIAFTTGKITLVAKGRINLKTEEMKINFNATPNNALKLSASELFNPYILVGGTLSKPAVGLDPTKVILHGGAAIGTAGISILAKGLLDRVGTAVPVCEDMLKVVQAKQ